MLTPKSARAFCAEHVPDLVSASVDPLRLHSGFEKDAIELGAWIVRVPKNAAAEAAMRRERRLLAALAGKIHARIPHVERVAPAGSPAYFDAYRRIPGEKFTHAAFDALSPEKLARLAGDLGRFLAELHAAIEVEMARELGFLAPPWPLPAARIRAALKPHRDAIPVATFALIDRALERHAALPAPERLVFVHGDLGGHNFTVDHTTGALRGVFDFGDAGIASPQLDFQYLEGYGDAFARAVVRDYEARAQVPIDVEAVHLRHVVNILCHVAFAAEDPVARQLAAKLAWLAPLSL